MGVLDRIDSPADLRSLTGDEMVELAAEIRAFLIEKVAASGGHIGPNLGVVELTRVAPGVRFAARSDPVRHRTSVIRAQDRHRPEGGIRQAASARGLTGYQERAESEHDWIESSHASAALSYADGLSKSFELTGQDRTVVAVVGDGALTGGMCWEALNNITAADRPVVIVVK